MLTTERVSQLQDAVLKGTITDNDVFQLLSRDEEIIVNELQNRILKYAAGLNELISEHK